jgi:hypothetical protein
MMVEFDPDKFVDDMSAAERNMRRSRWQRHERRITIATMRALEVKPGTAKQMVRQGGEDVSMAWLNRMYPNLPIKFTAYQYGRTFDLVEFIKKPHTKKAWKVWKEHKDNFDPDAQTGLVFSSVGDGFNHDLVLHDYTGCLNLNHGSKWRIVIPTKAGDGDEAVEPMAILEPMPSCLSWIRAAGYVIDYAEE